MRAANEIKVELLARLKSLVKALVSNALVPSVFANAVVLLVADN